MRGFIFLFFFFGLGLGLRGIFIAIKLNRCVRLDFDFVFIMLKGFMDELNFFFLFLEVENNIINYYEFISVKYMYFVVLVLFFRFALYVYFLVFKNIYKCV